MNSLEKLAKIYNERAEKWEKSARHTREFMTTLDDINPALEKAIFCEQMAEEYRCIAHEISEAAEQDYEE